MTPCPIRDQPDVSFWAARITHCRSAKCRFWPVASLNATQLESIGGRYFEDCNEAEIVQRRPDNFGGGVAPYAVDPSNAGRLWNFTTKLLA
jgi:hypothetical protein